MFFEVRCPGCERRGWCPCPDCVASLPAPASGPIGGLAATVSLFDHDELGARFVHALKLHNDRAILRWLAHSLVATVAARGIEAELITWAPTTAAARRERGFDQAELLARAIARASGVRVRSLLRRIDGPRSTDAPEPSASPGLVSNCGDLPRRDRCWWSTMCSRPVRRLFRPLRPFDAAGSQWSTERPVAGSAAGPRQW